MLITGIMALPSFGQESFNAENGGLNYVLPADNGYYFLCSGHIYFWNGDVISDMTPEEEKKCALYMAKGRFKDWGKDDANLESAE